MKKILIVILLINFAISMPLKSVIDGINDNNITISTLKNCLCTKKKDEFKIDPTDNCKLKSIPTAQELKMANIAWKYFERNFNKKTGLMNSANNYTSAAVWDWANGLYAIYTAKKFNIITKDEFEKMLHTFLRTMQRMKLFNNELPNKTYNTKSAKMTNYKNKQVKDGIGWSVADIARLLAALNMLYQCEDNLRPAIEKLLKRYRYCRIISVYGDMYGSSYRKGKLKIQKETMTGYEEYLARGIELWGHDADEARRYKFFKEPLVYGIKVPTDTRTFYSNFVGSESYWDMAFDFGKDDNESGEYIKNIYLVQEARYNHTKQFTAVAEDHIDRKPYFLYNTIYTNGEAWKIINHDAEDYNDFKSVSTKAGLAMKYLFDTPYANKIFDYLKNNYHPKKGYYAGIYETFAGANKALTLNTNSLVLETLLYSKMGALQKIKVIKDRGTYDTYRNEVNNFRCLPTEENMTIIEPYYPYMKEINSSELAKDLNSSLLAWIYFDNNYNNETGLINSAQHYKVVGVGDIGRSIMAYISANKLGILKDNNFTSRMDKLTTTLKNIQLFNNELPSKHYSAKNGDMLNNKGKKDEKGIGEGWDLYHIAHLMTGLYHLQKEYPQYKEVVYQIIGRFDFRRAITKKALKNNFYYSKKKEYLKSIIDPAKEYYIYNSLRLFGIKSYSQFLDEKDLEYKAIYNYEVPLGFHNKVANGETYLWSMLEHPYYLKYKHYSSNIYLTLKDKYTITGKVATSTIERLDKKPRNISNDIYHNKRNWSDFDKKNKSHPHLKIISTKASFIYDALYGYEDNYTKVLRETTKKLYNVKNGWYGGYYYDTKKKNRAIDIWTNSAILEANYYKKVGNFYYKDKDKLRDKIDLHHIKKDNIFTIESIENEFFYKAKNLFYKFEDNNTEVIRIVRKGLYNTEDNFVVQVGAFTTIEEANTYLIEHKSKLKNFTVIKTNINDQKFLLANRYYRYDYRLPYENKMIDEENIEFQKFYTKHRQEENKIIDKIRAEIKAKEDAKLKKEKEEKAKKKKEEKEKNKKKNKDEDKDKDKKEDKDKKKSKDKKKKKHKKHKSDKKEKKK